MTTGQDLLAAERYRQYLRCQKFGHRADFCEPPWDICELCCTWFRTETKVLERNIPQKVEFCD